MQMASSLFDSEQNVKAEPALKVKNLRVGSKLGVIFCLRGAYYFEIFGGHMSSITPVSSQAISPPVTGGSRAWTDVKIKRICLYIFAGLAVIGAAVCAGVAPIASLAFVLGSGASLWYARTLIDYQNPSILAALRRAAPSFSLSELLKKHGWDNLLYYQLLEPIAFESTYRSHADLLSFNEIVSLFYDAQSAIGRTRSRSAAFRSADYFIPCPGEWKGQFNRETRGMGCAEILDRYPLKDLKAFEIVSKRELGLLEKAASAVRAFREGKRDLEQRFFHETSQARSDRNRSNGIARLQCCLVGCQEIERAPEKEVHWIKDFSKERYKTLSSRCMTLNRIIDQGHALENSDLQAIESLENWLESSRWLCNRPAYRTSQNLRNTALRAVKEQFDRHTKPKRKEIDALQLENREHYEIKMAEIDNDFTGCRDG